MAKIEVVVGGADVAVVKDVFTSAGVTGYTSVSGISGMGHHGFHEGRLMFNENASLAMLITVVPEEKVDAILAGLRALFETHSGVVFVSDTYVSRPDYFAAASGAGSVRTGGCRDGRAGRVRPRGPAPAAARRCRRSVPAVSGVS